MSSWVDKLRESTVIVVGAGGGGDVVTAYIFCKVLEDVVGARECMPLGVLWERWVTDPYPGPVSKDSIKNAELRRCVWVNEKTYVTRGKYSFKPHVTYVAEVLGREIPATTLEYGVEGTYKCFKELEDLYGKTFLLDLDVGGDILAEGWEENLWSPLADSITLAATARVNGLVGVAAPGADGELPQSLVMQRISDVLSMDGYVGVLGFWKHHRALYEGLIDRVKTEASRTPYLALKGEVGVKEIRGGSRVVDINATTLTVFLLRSEHVLRINKLAQRIGYTRSLAEAWIEARKLGIPTELDLEVIASKKYGVGPEASPDWNAVRSMLKNQYLKTSIVKKERGDEVAGWGSQVSPRGS